MCKTVNITQTSNFHTTPHGNGWWQGISSRSWDSATDITRQSQPRSNQYKPCGRISASPLTHYLLKTMMPNAFWCSKDTYHVSHFGSKCLALKTCSCLFCNSGALDNRTPERYIVVNLWRVMCCYYNTPMWHFGPCVTFRPCQCHFLDLPMSLFSPEAVPCQWHPPPRIKKYIEIE